MNRTIFGIFIVILSVITAVGSTLFVLNTDISKLTDTSMDFQDTLHRIIDTVGPVTVSLHATTSGENEIILREGTGIIIHSDGVILTNKHLVSEGYSYVIQLDDARVFPAVVVKTHPTLDIALLKIVSDIPLILPVGRFVSSQASTRPGDTVVAIGNALGIYPQSISQGIIAGMDRTVAFGANPMSGLIQTSLPLSSGSSGGPLVGKDGKIIGINTGIVGGNSQIGWALPLTQDEVDLFMR